MDWWDWQGIGAWGFWGDAAGWVETFICRKCAGMFELRCAVAGVLIFDFMNPAYFVEESCHITLLLLAEIRQRIQIHWWLLSVLSLTLRLFTASKATFMKHMTRRWFHIFNLTTAHIFSGWEEVQPLPTSWLKIFQSDFRINESINDQWRITEEPQVESNYQAKNSRWCFKVSGW